MRSNSTVKPITIETGVCVCVCTGFYDNHQVLGGEGGLLSTCLGWVCLSVFKKTLHTVKVYIHTFLITVHNIFLLEYEEKLFM